MISSCMSVDISFGVSLDIVLVATTQNAFCPNFFLPATGKDCQLIFGKKHFFLYHCGLSQTAIRDNVFNFLRLI